MFSGDYAFMGSLIIKEVVKELLTKGLDKAKVLLLAGSRSVHQRPVLLFFLHAAVSPSERSLWVSPVRAVLASC